MAEQWVSFQKIKDQVSIKDVVDHYGLLLRVRKGGDELAGLCPFHEAGKGRDPFRTSVSKNNWHCFQCGRGGNILDLVAQREEVDIRSAALLIQEWFGTGARSAAAPAADTPPELVRINPPLQPPAFPLKNLNPQHPYLKERGLNQATVDHFGLGYCSRGLMKGRIAIPIHNEHGELVAYAGRWIGEPPEGDTRYKLPKGFVKTAVLFNLHRASKLAREKGEMIVVEGYFTVFKLFQCGIENAVALMGSYLAEQQKQLLVETLGPAGKVIVLFDSDEAGISGAAQCVQELVDQFFVKHVRLPEGVSQPDHLSYSDLWSLLFFS